MKKEQARHAKHPLPDFRAEDFFVLRSPLLPFEQYQQWLDSAEEWLNSAEVAASAAEGHELEDPLQTQLLRLARRPEIAEALFVASPSLMEGLARADESERSAKGKGKGAAKKSKRLRNSLTRYLLRLMTRSTPFGLFAAGSLGTVGDRTDLRLGDRAQYQRHTRLDMDYLYRLARDLERDHTVRPGLTYHPNSSLYRAAGRLRYAEGRHSTERRTYHLVAARDDEFLAAALDSATGGADMQTIAASIVAVDPNSEIETDEAEAFVHELIDAQLLVSDLGPRVTGPEPIHDLIDRLSKIEKTQPVAACLREVRDALSDLDRSDHPGTGALGSPAESYRQIAKRLEPLGTEVNIPRLFQVDMSKPGRNLSLGPEVVAEVESTIAFLYRLRGAGTQDSFKSFREDFNRRYEAGRAVPLVEVLDEEIGIGFNRPTAIGSEHSPLLQGIPFPQRARAWEVTWTATQNLITRKLFETLAQGRRELIFNEQDLDGHIEDGHKPLPDAIQAFFSVVRSVPDLPPAELSLSPNPSPAPMDTAASDTGREGRASEGPDFKVLFKSASGPSGATLLGRFCHGDEALAERVAEHLRREEAHREDAVFAEIVHLPEGRTGNVLCRPVLRDYEIAFLGQSGCDSEKQIPITDLMVTVVGEQVVLWSKRLGKQVIPRMTSAHNFSHGGLGMYRFLCALQHQKLCAGLGWSWGPLEQLPFLPRVVYGRSVISPAEWRIEKQELHEWCRASGAERAEKLLRWRQKRELPERVLLADGDNELFVDFKNALCVDALVAIVKDRPSIQLVEFLQDTSNLVVQGPDGTYAHEIILPFVRRVTEAPVMSTPKRIDFVPKVTPNQVRAHLPGSQWVYAKLYTGSSTADGLLTGPIHELVSRYGRELDSWFFLRYADPDFHLRVRFHIPDPHLRLDFQQRLSELAGRLLAEGRIWDLRFETYKPEIERYGGVDGISLCEQIFHADSWTVVEMLPALLGDAVAEQRWAAALASVDQLLNDLFAGDLEAHLRCLDNIKSGFAQEFGIQAATRKRLSARMRQDRLLIEQALTGSAAPESALGQALTVLSQRSKAAAPTFESLRQASVEGRLTLSLIAVGGSLAHMAVNRLIPAEARAHEAVLYDFLHRSAMSRRARQRAQRPVAKVQNHA